MPSTKQGFIQVHINIPLETPTEKPRPSSSRQVFLVALGSYSSIHEHRWSEELTYDTIFLDKAHLCIGKDTKALTIVKTSRARCNIFVTGTPID
jgi:hypothetical protein